jgi:tRNA (guanine-N7-)-methyltransferase
LNVDIGFGDGDFLIEMARRDPEGAYLGIERSFKRVLRVARRLAHSEIRNIRLVGIEAAWVVEEALEDESVATTWINFPDPWPRRRHQRRRLVAPRLIRALSHRLMVGGCLHIATDDGAYAEVIRSVVSGESLLENVYTPGSHRSERSGAVPTTFQREWIAQGRTCFFFQYRRRTAARVGRLDEMRASAHV